MHDTASAQDIAGKDHWEAVWRNEADPSVADPAKKGIGNLYTRRMDALFQRIFANEKGRGKSILEMGCGGSIWLPYFARQFEMCVAGIDYSELGCESSEKILRRARIQGKVVRGDFFSPPNEMLDKFDFVYSGGVVEHFLPTEECIGAFARFLKPGGIMITMVPNLSGLIGRLQRSFDRTVYDIHVPLTAAALKSAHEKAQLQVIESGYFLSTGFGILNVASLDQSRTSTKIKTAIIRGLARVSVLVWLAENFFGRLPNGRAFSPSIICVARKGAR
jgi:SAM-dependent methyltransferase